MLTVCDDKSDYKIIFSIVGKCCGVHIQVSQYKILIVSASNENLDGQVSNVRYEYKLYACYTRELHLRWIISLKKQNSRASHYRKSLPQFCSRRRVYYQKSRFLKALRIDCGKKQHVHIFHITRVKDRFQEFRVLWFYFYIKDALPSQSNRSRFGYELSLFVMELVRLDVAIGQNVFLQSVQKLFNP